MTRDNENEKSPNEEVTAGGTSTKEDERRKKEKLEEEVELDPDAEDPRLYSSLQEPDRPAPELRTSEEESDSDDDKDEKRESS